MPGSEFNALVMQSGILTGVEMDAMKRHLKLFTQTDDKLFVTVGLFSPKMEVAMCCLYPITQGEQHAHQSHTVCTSADCHQVESPVREELMLPDHPLHFPFHLI